MPNRLSWMRLTNGQLVPDSATVWKQKVTVYGTASWVISQLFSGLQFPKNSIKCIPKKKMTQNDIECSQIFYKTQKKNTPLLVCFSFPSFWTNPQPSSVTKLSNPQPPVKTVVSGAGKKKKTLEVGKKKLWINSWQPGPLGGWAPRTRKCLGSPLFLSHKKASWKGNKPIYGDLRSPWLLTTY